VRRKEGKVGGKGEEEERGREVERGGKRG